MARPSSRYPVKAAPNRVSRRDAGRRPRGPVRSRSRSVPVPWRRTGSRPCPRCREQPVPPSAPRGCPRSRVAGRGRRECAVPHGAGAVPARYHRHGERGDLLGSADERRQLRWKGPDCFSHGPSSVSRSDSAYPGSAYGSSALGIVSSDVTVPTCARVSTRSVKSISPMFPPGPMPGGMTNTAEAIATAVLGFTPMLRPSPTASNTKFLHPRKAAGRRATGGEFRSHRRYEGPR